jgi:ribose-phosphate pyrophosphokinase
VKIIEVPTTKQLYVVSGRSHLPLAVEIADCLGVELGEPNLSEFANGEIHCRYNESIRGADVFIVQSHTHLDGLTLNDSLMEQLIMVDAAKRASAKRISVVCPYYGYARQDRKAEGREPISAKLVADLFRAAGATRLISVDLHSGQIQGFFDGPVDHLTAAPVLIDYCHRDLPDNLVIVSPDTGRVKVAEKYANKLGADIAIVHKRHVAGQKNAVEAREVIGVVEGRPCVVLDDMIDTAGTIVAAAELLIERGASEVWAMATHGLFSGPAVDRLKNSKIDKVVVTNTLPLPPEKQFDKVEVLSVAPVIAKAIRAVFEDNSVSEIFDGENLS